MSKALKKWSSEEDKILLQQIAHSSEGKAKDWTAIASAIPGRSNKDCRKRWCNHLVGGLRKGPWDPSEDRRLAIGVKEYGQQYVDSCISQLARADAKSTRWTLVAEEVGTRSADQCAKRWNHSLDPSLDRSKWSEQEEERLLRAVEKHGRAWKQIQTEYFPDRASNNVKNKYVVLTRKKEPQNSDNEALDGESTSSENYTDQARRESTTSGPPRQHTTTDAPQSGDAGTFFHSDTMIVGHDYETEQSCDLLSFDMFSHAFPTAMDLDMDTTNPLTTEPTFDAGSADLVSNLPADSSSTTNINDYLRSSVVDRRFSTDTQTEDHSGSRFDLESDPQSAWNMDFFPNQPAKLILTIEDPAPDTVSGVTNVLISTKTKFTMEMR